MSNAWDAVRRSIADSAAVGRRQEQSQKVHGDGLLEVLVEAAETDAERETIADARRLAEVLLDLPGVPVVSLVGAEWDGETRGRPAPRDARWGVPRLTLPYGHALR